MIIDTEQALRSALAAPSESEHLEFKAARDSFGQDKLAEYCVALANEGGGHLILGVADEGRPRAVVGSNAFANLDKTKVWLFQKLGRRVETGEFHLPEGRVVVFRVLPSPPGYPASVDGRFLMRIGEQLVPMSADRMRELAMAGRGDLSAEPVPGATLDALDPILVERFRRLVVESRIRRGGVDAPATAFALTAAPIPELLEKTGLFLDGVTCAALVLLGTATALDRHLPQAEIIFEYRAADGDIPYQERRAYRAGFLGVGDPLWDAVARRNPLQSFQSGLLVRQFPTFDERSVREAILNAVSHRNYADQGSVFVRQFPQRLEVVSPGGFPAGITPETVLTRSVARNRALHEALERCGLVERSGQGARLMFSNALRGAKPAPSYSGTDAHAVLLTLDGHIRDPRLLDVLERVEERAKGELELADLRLVDALYWGRDLPGELLARAARLVQLGILEHPSRGKRFMLARAVYGALGRRGAYTREKGLDRGTEKALLEQHIRDNAAEGSPMRDLMQVLPALDRHMVNRLLDELRREGRVHTRGQRRIALWYPGAIEHDHPLEEAQNAERIS